jgi:hypothetical protein
VRVLHFSLTRTSFFIFFPFILTFGNGIFSSFAYKQNLLIHFRRTVWRAVVVYILLVSKLAWKFLLFLVLKSDRYYFDHFRGKVNKEKYVPTGKKI